MTETNDLLTTALKKVKQVFHVGRAVGERCNIDFCKTLDEAYADIEAYGKAEFERGRSEIDACAAYIKGIRDAETTIINNQDGVYQKTLSENKELKDQNKELMRENVKLIATKHCCSDQEACERRSEFMDFAKEVLSWGPVHGPEEFPNCRIDINAVLKELDSLEQKKPEPEWYDAEKCLPIMKRRVIVEYKSGDNVMQNEATLEYDKFCMRLPIFMIDNKNDPKKPPVVHSETGVISRWRYADENS